MYRIGSCPDFSIRDECASWYEMIFYAAVTLGQTRSIHRAGFLKHPSIIYTAYTLKVTGELEPIPADFLREK